MKLNIEIECTPEEARSFLGLPDLTPVHEAAVEKMMSLTKDGVAAKDMEAMMRAWMPGMGENWQALQKAFWSAAASRSTASRSPNETK
ncbi:MAG: DUF6489 family protein [Pseudomonadota bacterium]